MLADDFVPKRTSQGDDGLSLGDARVNGRQRQLLRLVDGSRSLVQIGAMLPGRDLRAELIALMAAGLLAAPVKTMAPAVAADTLPTGWADAMQFMKHRATESLGVMAHSIILLLEKVCDSAAAKSAVARWHMALRESRSGRAEADAHLQVVTTMLGL
ncbi:hypothetical protein [Uliginosibacterium gangwonense]|uniref:hypothetical protein n=1 Tax=Uliginosibacterium gangwonense TaxID=392736 RepID=UPI0003737D19|nr:hypothetical protein [Uliginosibacterium gangwonense]